MKYIASLLLLALPFVCTAQFNFRLSGGYTASSARDMKTTGNSNGYLGELKIAYGIKGIELGALAGTGEVQNITYMQAGIFVNRVREWKKIDGVFGISARKMWGTNANTLNGVCFGANLGADYKISKKLGIGLETGIYAAHVKRELTTGGAVIKYNQTASDWLTIVPVLLSVKYRL
jgi:hypothetical protein